eukprot:3878456-Rhodomonas_salina.2
MPHGMCDGMYCTSTIPQYRCETQYGHSGTREMRTAMAVCYDTPSHCTTIRCTTIRLRTVLRYARVVPRY